MIETAAVCAPELLALNEKWTDQAGQFGVICLVVGFIIGYAIPRIAAEIKVRRGNGRAS